MGRIGFGAARSVVIVSLLVSAVRLRNLQFTLVIWIISVFYRRRSRMSVAAGTLPISLPHSSSERIDVITVPHSSCRRSVISNRN